MIGNDELSERSVIFTVNAPACRHRR